MNTIVVGIVIGLTAGAVLGVLADWLLKPLLPQRPTLKHSIAGLLGCAVIVGVAVPFVGAQDKKPPDNDGVVAAEQIRECMRQHNLQQAQVRSERNEYSDAGTIPQFATIKFAQCEWPPPGYAGDDGYSEIDVKVVKGPGPHEAAGETIADRIQAPCEKLKLSYSFGKMGGFEHLPPFEVAADEIVTIKENGVEPWEGESYTLGFYPERGEFVVLHNMSYEVDEAVCAA